MRSFLELEIWKIGHSLVLDIYKLTLGFPKVEIFGLTSQMRRSSISIPSNISEGCGRNSDAEMKRFLTIASGSCSELQYQLLLSRDLEYVSNQVFQDLYKRIICLRKMIYKFSKNIPRQ